MDAVRMLLDDHERVRQLFREYNQAGNRIEQKQDIAGKVLMELEVHSKLEEEIFYPAVRERVQALNDIIEASYEEHRDVDLMIEQMKPMLRNMQASDFDNRMRMLEQNVAHHLQEEESAMLPQAQRAMGGEMDRLGDQMMQRRQQLMQQMRRAA